ncbi:unnamed protein product [Fraxinus pennsylvanica]|uniref:Uncharacterized protein n=1 Tax=Fraxinus pennsylvanica TaxID=56036 RepID=A0AAD1Z9K4_9LAMI|nr:unnamed protein product [Fraxinus pennsylvanica]
MQKLALCNDLVSHKHGFTGELPEWFGKNYRKASIIEGSKCIQEWLYWSHAPFHEQLPKPSGFGFLDWVSSFLGVETGLTAKFQNKLFGKIPSAAGDFSGLRLLNMSRNSFLGSIPASIEQLKTSLGNIPKSIGNCSTDDLATC